MASDTPAAAVLYTGTPWSTCEPMPVSEPDPYRTDPERDSMEMKANRNSSFES